MYLFIAPFLYVLIGYPVLRILQRTGYSGWWSLLSVIPVINIVALWVFAFAKWPNRPTSASVFE